MIKDVDGNNIVKEDEKDQRWCEHLQSVVNGKQPNELHIFEEYTGDDLQVNVENITHAEFTRVILIIIIIIIIIPVYLAEQNNIHIIDKQKPIH